MLFCVDKIFTSMGKQKRSRQKYHNAAVKPQNSKSKGGEDEAAMEVMLILIPLTTSVLIWCQLKTSQS